MKLSYTWIAVLLLLIASCKKDKLANASTETIKADYTVCADDGWITGLEFATVASNVCFTYNNKVYVPQEVAGTVPGDGLVHIFDGTTWTSKPCTPPQFTTSPAIAFSIGSKGYMGRAPSWPRGEFPFYEYNLLTNVWTRKADFPGKAVFGSACFTLNSKGYVVGGRGDDSYTSQNWEYNPASNTWTQRKSLLLVRAFATGFSIGNKGYILHGEFPDDLGYYSELTEYDPVTNKWTNKTDYPGQGRTHTAVFVIDGAAYAGGGNASTTYFNDFYKYNPVTDNWSRMDDIPAGLANRQEGFVLNEKGYMTYGTGGEHGIDPGFMAKYFPAKCVTVMGSGVNVNP